MKLWLLIGALFFLNPAQNFQWVSFTMVKRINARGKTTQMDAQVYFKSNGDMVTYLTKPTEMFVLNNRKGELQVYNPERNSVFKAVNFDFSSQNNTFYYFLGEIPNMGLDKSGYKIETSNVDEGFLVTTWLPPANLKAEIKNVEVVSDGEKVVFMGFIDEEDAYFKKVYFYNFTDLRGILFPNSITEIDYIEEDSVISKTTFHDFSFDNVLDKEILDFTIPENARLIE